MQDQKIKIKPFPLQLHERKKNKTKPRILPSFIGFFLILDIFGVLAERWETVVDNLMTENTERVGECDSDQGSQWSVHRWSHRKLKKKKEKEMIVKKKTVEKKRKKTTTKKRISMARPIE